MKKVLSIFGIIVLIIIGINIFKTTKNVKGVLNINEDMNAKFPGSKAFCSISNNNFIFLNFIKDHPEEWTDEEINQREKAVKEYVESKLMGIKSGKLYFSVRIDNDDKSVRIKTVKHINLKF